MKKAYIISFETSMASFTIRFEAENMKEAGGIAHSYMMTLTNDHVDDVIVTEELSINKGA